MKKLFLFPVMLLFALTIAACSNSPNGFEEPDTEQPETSGNDDDEDNKPEENSMKIKITVGNREVTATMKDNVTTRDFLSRLPIEVTMNDYAGAEKYFIRNLHSIPKVLPGGILHPVEILICMLLGETSLSFIKVEVIAVN